MITAILDASALLAVLLDEPGSEKVRSALASAGISEVNLSEVIGHFSRNGAAESDIRTVLDPLPVERYPFDGELAYSAGLLLPLTKSAGLSFGDRACLALAKRIGVRVLTADRAWLKIANSVAIEIEVIR
ncbi:MAG TPA: type II toxin-antitoxin system VapC family toxin [Rhodospirillaceae bacterium]|nr:type II toxin-antitoxin system VapC family toxin [Rhodospirillaceae bacterium]